MGRGYSGDMSRGGGGGIQGEKTREYHRMMCREHHDEFSRFTMEENTAKVSPLILLP